MVLFAKVNNGDTVVSAFDHLIGFSLNAQVIFYILSQELLFRNIMKVIIACHL